MFFNLKINERRGLIINMTFKKKNEEKEVKNEEEVQSIEEFEKKIDEAPKHEPEVTEKQVEEKPTEEKVEVKTWEVAAVPTATAPVLVNTKTKENYGDVLSVLAVILNKIEAIEEVVKEV